MLDKTLLHGRYVLVSLSSFSYTASSIDPMIPQVFKAHFSDFEWAQVDIERPFFPRQNLLNSIFSQVDYFWNTSLSNSSFNPKSSLSNLRSN